MQSARWVGKCQGCGSWNSYVEESAASTVSKAETFFKDDPVLLSEIQGESEVRLITDMKEFDRVMGGGVVQGSVTLIGGAPGIGKSTLVAGMIKQLGDQGKKALYISGFSKSYERPHSFIICSTVCSSFSAVLPNR